MKNILLTWVGKQDIYGFENSSGPNFNLMNKMSKRFELVYFLYNPELLDKINNEKNIKNKLPIKFNIKEYIKGFKSKYKTCKFIEIERKIKDSTNYDEIYKITDELINDLIKEHKEIFWHFHVSPGTPQMTSILVLLAKSRFFKNSKLYQTAAPEDNDKYKYTAKEVDFPFDVMLEHVKIQQELFEDLFYPDEVDNYITGYSPEIKRAKADSYIFSKTDIEVLILGPSGTGKELIARMIHDHSGKKGKFIKINCASITESIAQSQLFGYSKKSGIANVNPDGQEGYFGKAKDGTLFLDEIGDMPPSVQAMILRALPHKENNYKCEILKVGSNESELANIRIIAATNKDIFNEKNFREDLFYRLYKGIIKLPSLKSRGKNDIRKVSESILNSLNEKLKKNKSFENNAIIFISNYDWPGNIRQLENAIERACILTKSDVIKKSDIERSIINFASPVNDSNKISSIKFQFPVNFKKLMDEFEQKLLEDALKETNGNCAEAARLLKLDDKTNHSEAVTSKCTRLGIKPDLFKASRR
jgi:transcriptional regulator with PAS, ATPase and Fis domain